MKSTLYNSEVLQTLILFSPEKQSDQRADFSSPPALSSDIKSVRWRG